MSHGAMRARNPGIIVMTGKQSNMATVVRECAAVPCRLLKSVEANEDPS